MTRRAQVPTLTEMLTEMAEDSLLFADSESPFRATATVGDPRLAVVVGDNASGKSLFVRSLASRVHSAKVLPIQVSIRERTEAGIKRAFMFGEEFDKSTGATSVKVVQTAFNNLDRDPGSLLVLDEPEIGLAESYASAFGRYIAEQALAAPDCCIGAVIVTHSRPLVAGMLEVAEPTIVHTSLASASPVEPVTVRHWLDNPTTHSVEDLLDLHDTAFERWRTVNRLIESVKASRG